MAEAIGLAASIAGLVGITATVSRELRDIHSLYKDAPSDINALLKEIDGTLTVVKELQACLNDFPQDPLRELAALANIDPVILTTTAVVTQLHQEITGLKSASGNVKSVKRIRWAATQKEIERQCQLVQRLKLTLLLKLSIIGLRTELQLREAGTANKVALDGTITSMAELHSSVNATQNLLVQVLSTAENLDKQASDLRRDVVKQINACIPITTYPAVSEPFVRSISNQQRTSQRVTSEVALRALRRTTSLGDIEVVFGALKLFQPDRLRLPLGAAFRATYIPPSWLIKMAVTLSLGLGISPTLNLRMNLTTASIIHFDSDIFWFARHDRIDDIKSLFIRNLASPTDRDPDGWTALHEAAAQCNRPLCHFLLHEGADPTALSLPFANNSLTLTPIGWLMLSKKFRELPEYEKSEFLATFGIFGTPARSEIKINSNSPARLLFDATQAEYDDGPVTPKDLEEMDMNLRGDNGTTALMLAAGIGQVDAVRRLVQHGADPNLQDYGGWTALRQAAYYGHENCVEELLRLGADLWQRDLGVYGPKKEGQEEDREDEFGYKQMWARVMERLNADGWKPAIVAVSSMTSKEVVGTVVEGLMERVISHDEKENRMPAPKRKLTTTYEQSFELAGIWVWVFAGAATMIVLSVVLILASSRYGSRSAW